jgi:polyisoprenoid-binding protein YceI
MKRAMIIGLAIAVALVAVFGLYIAINFIIPSIVTEVAMTGVPTARSSRIDALRTQQAQTATARPAANATATTGAKHLNDGLFAASFGEGAPVIASAQGGELYVSCTAVRGATATPSGAQAATPEATAEATPEATAAAPTGEANFVFLTIDAAASEACYQVGEILRGNYVLVVGVTKTISGEVAIDLNNVANSVLGDEIVVNLSELRTDQPNRDRWMISANGFNFNQSPLARLTDTEILGLPARAYVPGETLSFQIKGKFEIKGQKYDAVFNAMGRYENNTLVVTAYYDTKLSEIGLFPPDLGFVRVNDEVRILLNLVARPQ